MVLQTHSVSNRAGKVERFCKASKAEVMRRCTKSLIESANYAMDMLPNVSFELVVLDDHSDEDSLEKLKVNLNTANFKTNLTHLDTRGIMPSILACYEYGLEHGKDWVYFIQDDYLYEKNAIYDMIVVANQTTENIGNYTCVFPYNDPYRYTPVNTVIQSHIIQMQGRHWRTQIMTGSPFMVHHSILKKEWDVFEKMGKHELSSDMEDNTINQLFRTRGYYLFVPIPSLALHMQYEPEKDPFIDWKEWWDKFDLTDQPIIDTSKQNLLTVKFHDTDINGYIESNNLKNYVETTIDLSRKFDISLLQSIPTKSIDNIFAPYVLEYFDWSNILIIIKEFNRILKDSGSATIVVKNLQVAAMYILQDKMFDDIWKNETICTNPLDIVYSINRYYIDKGVPPQKFGFTKNIISYISKTVNISFDIKEVKQDLTVSFTKNINE